jgi:hypothetical protein
MTGSRRALKNLDQTLTLVGKFPVAGAVDMLELRWSAELLRDSDGSRLKNLVQVRCVRLESLTYSTWLRLAAKRMSR